MKPVSTPRTDRTYEEHGGTDVYPLPCYEDYMGDMASTWELSDEDREALAAGGQICLTIGENPPPRVGMAVVGRWCEEHKHEQVWSPELKAWTCPVEEASDSR